MTESDLQVIRETLKKWRVPHREKKYLRNVAEHVLESEDLQAARSDLICAAMQSDRLYQQHLRSEARYIADHLPSDLVRSGILWWFFLRWVLLPFIERLISEWLFQESADDQPIGAPARR